MAHAKVLIAHVLEGNDINTESSLTQHLAGKSVLHSETPANHHPHQTTYHIVQVTKHF